MLGGHNEEPIKCGDSKNGFIYPRFSDRRLFDIFEQMSSNGLGYHVKNKPIFASRPIRIIVIGAGVAGIAAVYKFKQQLQGKNFELVVYEKNEDVGGTWLENQYPGFVLILIFLISYR